MKLSLKKWLPVIAMVGGSSLAFASPDGVSIEGISYGGSGCKQGTVGESIASDGGSFTLTFDDYLAEVGPGISRRESRKFCQVTLDLKVPHGWSYSVADFDYRGWASLDRGVTAIQKSSYYFDRHHEGSWYTVLRGEIEDDYLMSDSIDFSDLVWSPCGANRLLNIKTQISLRGRRGKSGVMTADSLDGKVQQIYGLKWRRCHSNY